MKLKKLDPKTIIVVPERKRTIKVLAWNADATKRSEKKYSINFPKSVFIPTNHVCTYAVNEEGELCYQPFLNIDVNGEVCMDYAGGGVKAFSEKFYNTSYSVCYDRFSKSLRKYFKPNTLFDADWRLMLGGLLTTEERTIETKKIINNIDNFYKSFNQLKLIPAANYDLPTF